MNPDREKEIRKEAEDKIANELKEYALARERHFAFIAPMGSGEGSK